MARTHSRDQASFPHLGPLEVPIPISTGVARLSRENDGSVLLEVNGVPSSHLHPDPVHLVFEYMRWMLLAVDQCIGPDRAAGLQIAHLGGGGCSLPRALAARYPSARQVVVEVDGVLAEQVREWFDLPRSPQLRIRVDDAARALSSWRDVRFDVLVRDVFAGATTPRDLTGLTAARNAARVLREGGVYLANCAAPPGTGMLADEIATLSRAFAHVGIIAEPAHLSGKRRGNCVLVASQAPLPESMDRALRSDAVSVRWARTAQVRSLADAGRVQED